MLWLLCGKRIRRAGAKRGRMMERGVWKAIMFGAACLVVPSAGLSQARAKFRCDLDHFTTLTDGKIAETSADIGWRKLLQGFTFDESTGVFRWPTVQVSVNYRVVQSGSTGNSVLAVYQLQGPASYSMKVLRIESFNPTSRLGGVLYPFLLLDEDMVMTGYCHLQ